MKTYNTRDDMPLDIVRTAIFQGCGSILLPMTRIAEWLTDCPREEAENDAYEG